jgi:hypothetical protein
MLAWLKSVSVLARMWRGGEWGIPADGEPKRWLKEVERVCCADSPKKKRLANAVRFDVRISSKLPV